MLYRLRSATVFAQAVKLPSADVFLLDLASGPVVLPAYLFVQLFEAEGKPTANLHQEEPEVPKPKYAPPSPSRDAALKALEYGPLTTAECAEKMYPESNDSPGRARAAYQILHALADKGIVRRVEENSLDKWELVDPGT